MIDEASKKRELLKLCHDLFSTTNLIGTDFDDVQISEVTGRSFPQQSNGAGIHICFSVSWHAVGKAGKDTQDAINTLLDR